MSCDKAKTMCGVSDCKNAAVCVGDDDGFPCCDEHCGHGGDDCTKIEGKE